MTTMTTMTTMPMMSEETFDLDELLDTIIDNDTAAFKSILERNFRLSMTFLNDYQTLIMQYLVEHRSATMLHAFLMYILPDDAKALLYEALIRSLDEPSGEATEWLLENRAPPKHSMRFLRMVVAQERVGLLQMLLQQTREPLRLTPSNLMILFDATCTKTTAEDNPKGLSYPMWSELLHATRQTHDAGNRGGAGFGFTEWRSLLLLLNAFVQQQITNNSANILLIREMLYIFPELIGQTAQSLPLRHCLQLILLNVQQPSLLQLFLEFFASVIEPKVLTDHLHLLLLETAVTSSSSRLWRKLLIEPYLIALLRCEPHRQWAAQIRIGTTSTNNWWAFMVDKLIEMDLSRCLDLLLTYKLCELDVTMVSRSVRAQASECFTYTMGHLIGKLTPLDLSCIQSDIGFYITNDATKTIFRDIILELQQFHLSEIASPPPSDDLAGIVMEDIDVPIQRSVLHEWDGKFKHRTLDFFADLWEDETLRNDQPQSLKQHLHLCRLRWAERHGSYSLPSKVSPIDDALQSTDFETTAISGDDDDDDDDTDLDTPVEMFTQQRVTDIPIECLFESHDQTKLYHLPSLVDYIKHQLHLFDGNYKLVRDPLTRCPLPETFTKAALEREAHVIALYEKHHQVSEQE